ncbi:MAG: hypothetical protein M4D80_11550 [Myxococcota bacterium]|nr:hypothetical protein [Deltaproteobacteria bacterium]MDQ3335794.1 hypothetical protein [Myxococcota bacterium]
MLASLVFVFATSGIASAETCEQEAAELHEHLERESVRASRWTTIWAILFGAAVVGQVTLLVAEVNPTGGEFDQDTKETLIVGASKATLAVGSKVILPLRIPVPSRTADACADVKALRLALTDAAKREKRSFWLTHLGGTAINIAGATILTIRRSLKVGAISFAVSYPIGPASAYTQPRRSWKLYREKQPQWVVGATATDDGGQLWIGGQW